MAIYYGDGSNSSSGRLIQTFEVGYESRWFVNSPSGSWHNGPGNLGSGINITPKDSNNKILVRLHVHFGHETTWTQGGVQVYRKIGSGSYSGQYGCGAQVWNSSRNGMFNSACLEYLDSPGTTNVCNYKLMFTSQDSGNYLRLNYGNLGSGGDNYSDHTPRSTLTVQEIAV
tara:strand:+ start:32 stop:544 length:513 start_codon:yes stop_codon:yes gene_type:complete